jgi:hypothetical protein
MAALDHRSAFLHPRVRCLLCHVGVRFNVPASIDSDVLGILSSSQWNSTAITYSLLDSRPEYQWVNPSANDYRPLTFETEHAVRYALEGYSPYSDGLSSVEGVTNLSLN